MRGSEIFMWFLIAGIIFVGVSLAVEVTPTPPSNIKEMNTQAPDSIFMMFDAKEQFLCDSVRTCHVVSPGDVGWLTYKGDTLRLLFDSVEGAMRVHMLNDNFINN